jgi:hypothetical protein
LITHAPDDASNRGPRLHQPSSDPENPAVSY